MSVINNQKKNYPVKSLTINGGNISEYVITVNGSESSTVAYAASELQKYIALSVGITLPVQKEGVPAGTKRILIDETAVPKGGDYIYRFYNDEDGLVIGGDPVRGCMYSVYHFLEKKLNWRFFASDTEVCYGGESIDLSDLDYTYKHPYELRDIYLYDYNHNPAFCVKRYLNGVSGDKSNFGGCICYTPLGIHNFGRLSETGDGVSPNPCLNSDSVRAAILKNVREFLKEHPDAPFVQISQNDTDERCHCELCEADAANYGAPSATIVKAMNYLAEQLHDEYPDLLLVTFAYRYSVFAPENIVCHPNVVIEFTPIDMCRRHPLSHAHCDFGDNEYTSATAPCNMTENQYLMEAIEKWKKVSKKFCIYEYGLDCGYYYTPYPDMDSLLENYRVLNSLGAIGYMNLSNPHIPSAEFGGLRGYLTLKLLEEPGMTAEAYDNHINEFLQAFYGPAWTIIREYFDFIHDLASRHNKCYTGYNSPEMIYGDHAFAPYSDQLVEWFDKAEKLTENETQLLHIKRLRASMDWVRIGAIHYAEMHSGDEERVRAMTEEVEKLYHTLLELGLNWITEAGPIPSITDFTVNPREWGKTAPHAQLYKE